MKVGIPWNEMVPCFLRLPLSQNIPDLLSYQHELLSKVINWILQALPVDPGVLIDIVILIALQGLFVEWEEVTIKDVDVSTEETLEAIEGLHT